MPDNKLQHYVPKAHMRAFSVAEGKASINLYNIDLDKIILDASIKGQCARPYFYGKDLGLEKALQEPEGVYAAIVKKGVEDPATISDDDLRALRDFTLLQTFRTYAYVEKLMAVSETQHADMKEAAPGRKVPEPFIETIGEAVLMGFQHFLHGTAQIADLEMCVVVNATQREFITSDDPAVSTNRFHLQKLQSDAFGLATAGAMFFLPLTPRLAFVAYDPNVYYVSGLIGNVVTTHETRDVLALNELQFLQARKNIYYSDPASGERIAKEFKHHAAKRPNEWVRWKYFLKTGDFKGGETFEQVDKLEFGGGKQYMSSFHIQKVKPSNWFGLIKNRLLPRFVDTKTSAGVLRPDHPALKDFGKRRGDIKVLKPKPVLG